VKQFVNLHSHTSFSQLDGASKISEYVARAKELGMPAAGISDHGSLSGIVDFYKECKKQDIKPVLGIEAYFTDNRFLKESVKQEDANGEITGSDKRYYHLSVYAENNEGYHNLLKLSTDSYLNGFYHKPRCLLAGQEIVTRNGYKKIEDIQLGDEVLSHTGSWKPVAKLMKNKYFGPIVGLKLASRHPRITWMTPEHPVLIRDFKGGLNWVEAGKILPGRRTKTENINSWNSWVCLPKPKPNVVTERMKVSDYTSWNYVDNVFIKEAPRKTIGSTWHYSNCQNEIELDYKFGRFIGLYIAEGHTSKNEVVFSLHEDELEYIEELCCIYGKLTGREATIDQRLHRPDYRGVSVRMHHSVLRDVMVFLCGSGANNKHVPDFLWDAPVDFQKGVYDGVLAGDGSIKDTITILSQTSERLAWEMRTLGSIFSDSFASVVTVDMHNPDHHDQYRSNFSTADVRQTISDVDYVYKPVNDILLDEFDGIVYNIEVEDDHSYVSDFAMHNCDYSSLEQYSKGLIVGSGCLGGPVLQPLLHGNFDGALATAQRLQDIVGKDNFFIELMNHGLPEQTKTNPMLLDIAKKIGAGAYASQDTHYTHKESAHSHAILLCQPAGTSIRLSDGSNKAIETVRLNDEVASWRFFEGRQHESHLTSNTVVDIQNRHYNGELITLSTESGRSSTYTHDHICVVNASDAWLDDGNYVVYMQREGDSFRIGKTTYQKVRARQRPDAAVLGVLTRAKEQNAEAAWILSVHKTEHEALEEEAFISWKYNIPTWSFPFPRKKGHEPRTLYYESLWNRIGSLYEQAEACLKDYGRDIRYPFWSINDITRHSKWTPYVRACNILPGMMVCVFSNDSRVTGMRGEHWEPVKVARTPYIGEVYAIEVDENHTYIADGIVTHNCCQTGSTLDDPKRFHFHNDEYYLKSSEQMREIFKDNEEVCDNTLVIAERCNVDIDFSSLHLPQFPIPEGFDDDVEYLVHLVVQGIQRMYPDASDEVWERAEYELGVFQSMGVSSYMLIIWDIIEFAKREGMFISPGRGSVGGSIVAYALGITKVDPIKYGLIFERFLNPSRIALPDACEFIPSFDDITNDNININSREIFDGYNRRVDGRISEWLVGL